jgi:hypothetical protein
MIALKDGESDHDDYTKIHTDCDRRRLPNLEQFFNYAIYSERS